MFMSRGKDRHKLRWNERSLDPLPHYTYDLPAVIAEVNTHSAARENM